MNLKRLLNDIEYELYNGSLDKEVTTLVYDSRKLTEGCLFVCVRGTVFDAHDYIDDAVKIGAAAIITDHKVEITKERENVTFICAKDCRNTLARVSCAYFDYPDKKLFTIGITGTKGKTTTAFMVKDILEKCGYKTGLIGTIQIETGSRVIESVNTTPESYDVFRYFNEMAENGCKCVVMEVSSQAMKMKRCEGINFDLAVFTNLEPDHIGPNEHVDFREYLECKALLFKQCKTGIFNCDDEHFDEMVKNQPCKILTYGLNSKADFIATDIKYNHELGHISTSYKVRGKINADVDVHLPGKFTVYNSLCAIAICSQLDVDTGLLKEALIDAKVKGRVEPVKVSDKFILMIDYAHNAMSLKSILQSLREYNPHRIVCLFGCGGNRSKLRRFEMGEVSGTYADLTIITSDNPRDEEPLDIIADIKTGISKTTGKYVAIADRKEAIRYAIENAEEGDIILLAGKGHENYQEIKGKKYPMDERELIRQILEEK